MSNPDGNTTSEQERIMQYQVVNTYTLSVISTYNTLVDAIKGCRGREIPCDVMKVEGDQSWFISSEEYSVAYEVIYLEELAQADLPTYWEEEQAREDMEQACKLTPAEIAADLEDESRSEREAEARGMADREAALEVWHDEQGWNE
jgi:hypothetical protein